MLKIRSWTPYIIFVVVVALLVTYSAVFSSAARAEHVIDLEASNENLTFKDSTPPGEMTMKWEKEGYDDLISSPGVIVAARGGRIERLDSETGDVIWFYDRPGDKLCDVITAHGAVVALYNPGGGCTDITSFNASTGKMMAQAQYGTNSEFGSLAYNATEAVQDDTSDSIALVTPHLVRLLRWSDLVPKATFGDIDAPRYGTDQEHSDCTVSDVVVSQDNFAVAAKCDGDETYKIHVMDADPGNSVDRYKENKTKGGDTTQEYEGKRGESTEAIILQTIDTYSPHPVTLPVMSISMIVFVAQDTNPVTRVWQLDKDHQEVAAFQLDPGAIGYHYQDLPLFGYVWRIGDWVRYRSGSEDLSQGEDVVGAVGDPMVAGENLLVPTYEGIAFANYRTNKQFDIKVDIPVSNKFAFAGRTVVALGEDGTLRAFR